MKKYFIISDLDGTIVTDDLKIPDNNIKALKNFIADGGNFAIATGRTPENSMPIAKYLTINAPCVFYNGAMLYDWQLKKPILVKKLTGDIFRDFVKDCLDIKEALCIEIYTTENCVIVSDSQFDDPELEVQHYNYVHKELKEIVKQDWLKILFAGEEYALKAVQNIAIKYNMQEVANTFRSGKYYFEVVAKNVSKGAMLEEIRKIPKYAKCKFISMGDFPNDNEMLKNADIGIAPANAHQDTKNVADVIGVDCKSGLLEYAINIINYKQNK